MASPARTLHAGRILPAHRSDRCRDGSSGYLVDYMRGNPKHRGLFGTNHPFWPASECLTGLDDLGLGEECAVHLQALMKVLVMIATMVAVALGAECLVSAPPSNRE